MSKEAFTKALKKRLSQALSGKKTGKRTSIGGGIGGMSEKDTKEHIKNIGKENPSGSLTGWLTEKPIKKVLGKQRYEKATGHFNRALTEIDSALGKPLHHVAKKFELTKDLFKAKEKIPTGHGHYKEVDRISATAPLTALHGVAAPMVLTGAGYKAIEDSKAHKAALEGHKGEQ